jgi:rubrerythrin
VASKNKNREPEQLGLAGLVLVHDHFAEKLGSEFAIMLLPVLDKSMPLERCREVADRLALLASKRARDRDESLRLVDALKTVTCRGCDATVEHGLAVPLCPACGAKCRTPGAEG